MLEAYRPSKVKRLIVAFITIGALCNPKARADGENVVRSSVSGQVSLAKANRSEGVSISYEHSPELAQSIKSELTNRGWRVSDNPAATVKVRIVPRYVGKAEGRPLIGNEGEDSSMPSPPLFDPFTIVDAFVGAALLIRGSKPESLLQASTTGRMLASSNVVDGAKKLSTAVVKLTPSLNSLGRSKLTTIAQDAYLVNIQVEAPGVPIQHGQVLTESFAEGVPPEILIKDNLNLIIWFLD